MPAVCGGLGLAGAGEDRSERRQPRGDHGEKVPGPAVVAQPQQYKADAGGRIPGRVGQRTPGGKQPAAAGVCGVNNTAGEAAAGPRGTQPDVFGDKFTR